MAASPCLSSIPYEAFESICNCLWMLDITRMSCVCWRFRAMSKIYLQLNPRRWFAELQRTLKQVTPAEEYKSFKLTGIKGLIMPGIFEVPDSHLILRGLGVLRNIRKLQFAQRFDVDLPPHSREYHHASGFIQFVGQRLVLLHGARFLVVDCQTAEVLYDGLANQGLDAHSAKVAIVNYFDENDHEIASVDVLIVLCCAQHPHSVLMYDPEAVIEPSLGQLVSYLRILEFRVEETPMSYLLRGPSWYDHIEGDEVTAHVRSQLQSRYPNTAFDREFKLTWRSDYRSEECNRFRKCIDYHHCGNAWSIKDRGIKIKATDSTDPVGLSLSIRHNLSGVHDRLKYFLPDMITPIQYNAKVLYHGGVPRFVLVIHGQLMDHSARASVITFTSS